MRSVEQQNRDSLHVLRRIKCVIFVSAIIGCSFCLCVYLFFCEIKKVEYSIYNETEVTTIKTSEHNEEMKRVETTSKWNFWMGFVIILICICSFFALVCIWKHIKKVLRYVGDYYNNNDDDCDKKK
jgi:hypothetical protein